MPGSETPAARPTADTMSRLIASLSISLPVTVEAPVLVSEMFPGLRMMTISSLTTPSSIATSATEVWAAEIFTSLTAVLKPLSS